MDGDRRLVFLISILQQEFVEFLRDPRSRAAARDKYSRRGAHSVHYPEFRGVGMLSSHRSIQCGGDRRGRSSNGTCILNPSRDVQSRAHRSRGGSAAAPRYGIFDECRVVRPREQQQRTGRNGKRDATEVAIRAPRDGWARSMSPRHTVSHAPSHQRISANYILSRPPPR